VGKARAGKGTQCGAASPLSDRRSVPGRFLVPGILLLLGEEPMHGYALLDKLVELGVAERRLPLPIIYRELLQMEGKKLVGFKFARHEGRGPARKVYHLTEKGRRELCAWAERMLEVRRFADEFRARCEELRRTGALA